MDDARGRVEGLPLFKHNVLRQCSEAMPLVCNMRAAHTHIAELFHVRMSTLIVTLPVVSPVISLVLVC
jgi:hypothetical protein